MRTRYSIRIICLAVTMMASCEPIVAQGTCDGVKLMLEKPSSSILPITGEEIRWEPLECAVDYEVDIWWTRGLTGGPVSTDTTEATSFWFLPPYLTTVYRIRITARDHLGGATSSSLHVSSGDGGLTALQPDDAGPWDAGSVLFKWSKSRFAVSYRFQLSDNESFIRPLVDHGGVTDTTYSVPGVDPGHYVWRVALQDMLGRTLFIRTPIEFEVAQPVDPKEWTAISTTGLPEPEFSSFAATRAGTRFAISRFDLYRLVPGSSTWTPVSAFQCCRPAGTSNNHGGSLVVDRADVVFVSGPNGVFRSTDQGATWTVSIERTDPVNPVHGSNLAVGGDGRVYVVTSDGTFVSEDSGEHWTLHPIKPALRSLLIGPTGALYAMSVHGFLRSPDLVGPWNIIAKSSAEWCGEPYLGIDLDGVLYGQTFVRDCRTFRPASRSFDGGDTWSEFALPTIDSRLRVTSNGRLFALSTFGLFESRDAGATWSAISTIPATDVYQEDGRELYAFTRNGRYVSIGQRAGRLRSPPFGTVGLMTTTTLEWTREPDASRYDVQVAMDVGFSEIVFHDNLPSTRIEFVAPYADRRYFWHVRPVTASGPSGWSELGMFDVGSLGPLTPAGPYPDDGVYRQPSRICGLHSPSHVTFQWGQTVNPAAVAHYHLQVSIDSSFGSLVIDENELTETEYVPDSLEYDRRYFWRVAGVDDHGRFTFTRPAVLGTTLEVTLIEPLDEATGVSSTPLFKWEPAVGAHDYLLHVSTRDDPLKGVWSFEEILLQETEYRADRQHPLFPLEHGTRYFWSVSARRLNCSFPTYFERLRSFKVAELPVVELKDPADGMTGVSPFPTLSWEPLEGDIEYHLQLSLDTVFSSRVFEVAGLTTTSWAIPVQLSYSTTYYWRVRVHDPAGDGPWSKIYSFTVAVGTAAEGESDIPTAFALHPNYPNPFNPSTTITYDVPEAARVRLTVFDALGRLVKELGTWNLAPGTHAVTWSARAVPSGMYFVRMEAGAFSSTRQLILLK